MARAPGKMVIQMFTSDIVAAPNEDLMFPADVKSSTETTMIEEISDDIAVDLISQDYSFIDIRIGRSLIHVQAAKVGVTIEKTYDLSGTLVQSSTKSNGAHSEFGSDAHGHAHDILISNIKDIIALGSSKKMLPITAATVKNTLATVNRAMAELYPACRGTSRAVA